MAEIPKGVAKHVIEAMVRLENSGLPYKPGDLIGRKYEVHGLLGAGGFGAVYLVYDHQTKNVFALKTHYDRYFKEAEAREVLRREAYNLVKLERHAYLVRAYFVDEISGRLYITMEYIAPDEQGLNSLHGYLKRQPPDLAQSLRWSIQFCYGMEYARSKGIRCHGDIKPDNIMISDNTVKISDFGLARVVGEVEKVAWFVKVYTAPEIIQGKGADERSDIYSFGVVLYQMVTSTPEPPLSERITNVNGPIKAIILRCIEEEPDKRYPTFKELQGDLEPLLKKETEEVIKPPEMKELETWELINQGKSLSHLNRFDEAISYFNKALEIDPRDAEAYLNRGTAYANKGDYDRAILDYNKALEINPRYAEVYINRGNAYADKGNYDRAILDYNKELEMDPRDAVVYYNRGKAYADKGDYDRAILDFNKALEINPRFAKAHYNRGKAYVNKGDYDRAILDYNKALEINPRDEAAYNNQGNAYAEKGDYDHAILDYNKALEINPMYAEAHYNRAICYYYKREYDKALEDVHKAQGLGCQVRPRFLDALRKASGRQR